MSARLTAVVIACALAAAAAFGASLWLAYPFLQQKRADAKNYSANSHIEAANRQMSSLEIEGLGPDFLISPENIKKSQDLLAGARPALKEASREIGTARDDMEAASGLSNLPGWYGGYLEKKVESASLRKEQVLELVALTEELAKFYGSAPPVLKAVEDMDRLQGQLISAVEMSQSRPDEAIALLEQVKSSFEQMRQEMNSQWQQTGFEIFSMMAEAATSNNAAAGMVSRFAAAARAGDQAEAQMIAGELDVAFAAAPGGQDAVGMWWDEYIKPRTEKFQELQARLEELDSEARELYRERS